MEPDGSLPHSVWTIRNVICFYGEELLAPCPIPKLKGLPLSAVPDCLLKIFTATFHIGGHFTIRNLRTRCALLTGTNLSRQILTVWCNLSVLDTMLCLPVIVLFVLCFFVLISTDQMLQSSAWHLCFVFRVPGIKSSVQKPAVVIGPSSVPRDILGYFLK